MYVKKGRLFNLDPRKKWKNFKFENLSNSYYIYQKFCTFENFKNLVIFVQNLKIRN